MAQNLDLNINVNTDQAGKSIGSLKTQLREAQADVVKLSDKFGATSIEAVNAAKKAAELRDRIGDARALTDAFNPDQKFKALTSSLAGVAGGFAAVQGAMGLFGAESEDLQKTLVKVQSAMALSQGLEAVGNSIDSFKNLGTVIRTQVVTAFSTLRGAIIATGVGALAVGLGLIIANFEKVKETLTNLFPGLIEFGNQIKNIVQGITDFVGITSAASRAQNDFKLGLETSNKAIDNQIKILEAQGGKEDEIYEQKKQRINNQIKLIKGSTQEELQARADLNTELQVLDLQEDKRKQKIADDAAAARKKEEADEKARLERAEADAQAYEDFDTQLQQRLMELDEERATKKRELEFQNIQNQINDYDYLNELEDNDFADDQQRLANKEALIAEQKLKELSNLNLTEKERLEIIAKYAKQEQEIDKAITSSKKAEKQAQVQETIRLMGQLTDFVGKDTVAGKAFGIATATINTFQGASEALKQKSTLPSPFDVIAKIANVATIIATGVKTVKAITSVQVPGSSGGAGGSIPSISSIAPLLPQLPTAQMTQLNQQSINDLGNQAVRAYVIETDVTGNQQRMAAIKQRARFS